MRLHFQRSIVLQIAAHARESARHKQSIDERYHCDPAQPALWLVNDNGIYLMSNGDPALLDMELPERPDGTRWNVCAHARECNPHLMPFEEWWRVMREACGTADHSQVIPLEAIEEVLFTLPEGEDLVLDVTLDRTRVVPRKAANENGKP